MAERVDCFDYVGTEVLLARALTELQERRLQDPEKKSRIAQLTSEVLALGRQLRAERRRADRLERRKRVPEPVETFRSTLLKERLEHELASLKEYYGQLISDNAALRSKVKELRDEMRMFTCLQPCSQRVELADTVRAVRTEMQRVKSVQRQVHKAATAALDEAYSTERLRRLNLDYLEALITDNMHLERSLERESVRETEEPAGDEGVFDGRSLLDALRAEVELCEQDYGRLLSTTKAGRLRHVSTQTEL